MLALSCNRYQQVHRCHTLYHSTTSNYHNQPPFSVHCNNIHMMCKSYVTPSEGSGSKMDTMIESGILQRGRTA